MSADEIEEQLEEQGQRIHYLKQVMDERMRPNAEVLKFAEERGIDVEAAAEMLIESAEEEIAELRADLAQAA
ncbi:MAG: hypothetical protein K0S35_979 [Geminicoccaceae bacterium]|jgi:DNA polymerase I-like protein with 3'-5' exonuclease and polymerase domains|nr:hypothetical protein [Geminicoccaceae bacterium]